MSNLAYLPTHIHRLGPDATRALAALATADNPDREPFIIGNAIFPQLRPRGIATAEGAPCPLSLRRRGNPARPKTAFLTVEVEHILHLIAEDCARHLYENGLDADADYDLWAHLGDQLAAFPECALAAVFGPYAQPGGYPS